MTFRVWYEEVEGKSYHDLSPREKNSLECHFFKFLRDKSIIVAADSYSHHSSDRSAANNVSA